jgi:hypothetical protein
LIESGIQPLEQIPASVAQLTSKAIEQAREVGNQIRQRVGPS